ncbi:forkhead box protein Q1-like [Scylla paramamosain]|uniref:forkhead box protein Q1-like n=1 Tax=Scylla paramamosain TaxID=85552 RepID=UPI003083E0E8
MPSSAPYPSLPRPPPPPTVSEGRKRGEVATPSPPPLRRPPARRVYVRHPKPPQTYVELIGEALESSPSGALTLGGISEYLRGKYTFFRGPYQGWRNSVRHNLSLNQDNLWTLDPPPPAPPPSPEAHPPTTHRGKQQ